MVEVSNKHKSITVGVSSNNGNTVVTASSDTSQYWANQSHTFANQSKESAQDSKHYAELANSYIEGFEDVVTSNTNNIITTSNDCINQIAENTEAAIDSINNTKTDIIADIEFVADGEKQVIQGLVDDEKEEIKDLANLIKENAQDIASRTSFAMFDTVLKDHILTYEESKGLALQGTYVYKEAIAGSRYGYTDFYNKCLEEYENSSNTKQWLKSNVTYVGSVVDNKGVLSGFTTNIAYAQIPVIRPTTSFELVVKAHTPATFADSSVLEPYAINTGVVWRIASNGSSKIWMSGNGSGWSICSSYNPNLTIPANTDVWFKVAWNGTQYDFAISTDGSTWTMGNPVANTTSIYWNTYQNLGGASWESFPWQNGTIDLKGCYLDIDGERYWNGVDYINYKQHSNGHLFYDISEKDKVDEFFNATGSAWVYGIDQENERIFLPRDNFFAIKGIAPVAGNGMVVGLTNGIDDYGLNVNYAATGNEYFLCGSSGNLGASLPINASSANLHNAGIGITTDATKSGIEAHIEANEDKYLYICVGNTVSQSAITDVVDVTTTENDTTPLFTGMYFDFTPNNVSWLKAGEQKKSGDIYAFCYNELVNILNGEKKYGNLKVINEADMIAGVDYSEYWKVNQDEMTFTAPTAISNKALSGAVAGNGMTLGFTDGASNYGVVYGGSDSATNRQLQASISAYGANNGSTGLVPTNNSLRTMGITTDSTKSGIIAEQSTSQLYFKVANAVQNLELLDAGEVLEAVNSIIPNNSSLIASYGLPDYSSPISITGDFTAPTKGFILGTIWIQSGASSGREWFLNGVSFGKGPQSTFHNICIPVNKEDALTFPAPSAMAITLSFYPLKGVNQ